MARAATKTNTRTRVRKLVDVLPERELRAAQRYLEYLRDQGDPLAHVGVDDEPTTEEDRASARKGWDAYKRGDYVTADDLKRELQE